MNVGTFGKMTLYYREKLYVSVQMIRFLVFLMTIV